MPGLAQLSFEVEPISDASWAPREGRRDRGLVSANEFFQLYTLEQGALGAADGWPEPQHLQQQAEDGSLIGYSSTRRNSADSDLYVMDPRDRRPTTSSPKSRRRLGDLVVLHPTARRPS